MRIFCSFGDPVIQVVGARFYGLAFAGNNDDFPRFVDFYARNMHTGGGNGFDRPGHI
jgi:hypothetical protein